MENVGVVYLTMTGCLLLLVYLKERMIRAEHQLDQEYLVAMWLLHIEDLDTLGKDTMMEKQLVIDYLVRREVKLPKQLVSTAEVDWLPDNLIKNNGGKLFGNQGR